MSNPPPDEVARVRQVLAGYPAATVSAAVDFARTRSPEVLDQVVLGVLAFHLPRSANQGSDLAGKPGTTQLVAELSVDSLSMVEMSFLLTDLLGVTLSEEDMRKITTIDDLTGTVRRYVFQAPPA
jgi:acyl carrier protein